jgi:hypothetical protein
MRIRNQIFSNRMISRLPNFDGRSAGLLLGVNGVIYGPTIQRHSTWPMAGPLLPADTLNEPAIFLINAGQLFTSSGLAPIPGCWGGALTQGGDVGGRRAARPDLALREPSESKGIHVYLRRMP